MTWLAPDRSKTPIEPYLADQWFVRMQELAQSAMDAVSDERVQIFPTRYRKGYLDWLGENEIGRLAGSFGGEHQIPIWSYACQDQEDLMLRLPVWKTTRMCNPDKHLFKWN